MTFNAMIVPKFLSYLPAPIGIVLFVMCFAAWKRSRRAMLSAVGLLVLFSSSFVSSLLLYSLESRYPVIPASVVPHSDAIVILGGITSTTQAYPRARVDLSEHVERIDEGARLFLAGVAPVIVLTSGSGSVRNDSQEGDHLRRYLEVTYRIPADRIVHTAHSSSNTAEEARNVGILAKAQSWSKVTLVTSAYHMPRAVMLFSRADIQVDPHPVDFRSIRDPREPLGNRWFPRADFLSQTEIGMREYYGILFYKWFGK